MRTRFLPTMVAVGVLSLARVATANHLDTLANLAANPANSLSIGDKTWYGFDYQATALTTFDPADITVMASILGGVYYLDFFGSIAVASTAPAVGDLLLTYTVEASGGNVITMIDQSYTGSAQPVGQAFISIDESVYDGTVIIANSHLEVGDLSDPFAEAGDDLITNGKSKYLVVKDIAIGVGAANGGFVTISDVKQSFHQDHTRVPDSGTTAILLGLALSALGYFRRKIVN